MKFSDIPGHDALKEKLRQSVIQKRIAHAQLFLGPEGCGALPLAIAYAQYLCCAHAGDDSCGTCSSCIKYNKLIHPDLHFSFPTISIKEKKARSEEFMNEWRKAVLENPFMSLNEWYAVLNIENKQAFMSTEESADIIRQLSLKSYESPFKVMIIWMVEKMRTDALTKLLKTLEEPPGQSLIILITESSDQLPGTILSRTQLVKIKKYQPDELRKILQLRHGMTYHDAQRLVRLSDGNYNTAMQLHSSQQNTPQLETEFIAWMRMCYSLLRNPKDNRKNLAALNEWIDKIADEGREQQKVFLHYGLEVLHECLAHNYAGEIVKITDQEIPGFSKFAPFIHFQNADDFQKELSRAVYYIERNANPRILFLDLSFKMNALLHRSKN